MSAETLSNETLNTPANDDLHQLQTVNGSGKSVTLRDSVEVALENYFEQLDGAPVSDVYQLVLSEVEAPLLEQVMKYTRNNQTKASTMLGLNRGTLRKKLKQYGLL
ncbi:Fis family transcriptional regulator, factor for inversion stimulation protein [Marinobacter persicus]|uniref:Putative Fis-like DNA-binding protein n=1 Tax=Marinobacter persicus TaxID=930118 RepID=A0A1I3QZ11_9GAMM|nr:DNA-binding transcriptional regulator Fis [Marinobacter persicus]GHD43260.1 DNA-binding protein Fis [Marinobacter persicus]SFJ39000.1 Fis family transcriptional regulator, factor for inversion stimulation protein [Marinobacter persicus]